MVLERSEQASESRPGASAVSMKARNFDHADRSAPGPSAKAPERGWHDDELIGQKCAQVRIEREASPCPGAPRPGGA
jgi:hypothetical protein